MKKNIFQKYIKGFNNIIHKKTISGVATIKKISFSNIAFQVLIH